MIEIHNNPIPDSVDPLIFRNVVSAAYTAYIGNGGIIPHPKEIKEYCRHSIKTIAKVLDTPEFRRAITARGINWTNESGLSTKQMLALQMLTNPLDRRGPADKLKAVGVTTVEYRAWLKEPKFRRYVDNIGEQMLGEQVTNVHNALVNKANSGDVRAIQLYYELTGRHDPAQKQVVVMQDIIRMLLEVLTKHVTDPMQLSAISNEIDLVIMPKLTSLTSVTSPKGLE